MDEDSHCIRSCTINHIDANQKRFICCGCLSEMIGIMVATTPASSTPRVLHVPFPARETPHDFEQPGRILQSSQAARKRAVHRSIHRHAAWSLMRPDVKERGVC